MKIVHIHWGLSFGGIETMLVNIANEQARLGEEVTIIAINENNDKLLLREINPNVKLVCLGRKLKSHSLMFIYKLNYELFKIRPDAIHIHESRFVVLLLFQKFRRITFATQHCLPNGTLRSKSWQRFLPHLYQFFHGANFFDLIPNIISISNAVKTSILEKYQINSIVIYNGINTMSFDNSIKNNALTTKKIITVGRLVHKLKGQDILIRAASLLKCNATVTIVGEGPSLEYLLNLKKELICDDIFMLGKKSQEWIYSNLSKYDLFVLPSRLEGFGLTVAEAMAAGVPVLVSSGQGPAEVTCGDKFGWVFENGNVDDLVDKIKYIFDNYNEAMEKANIALCYVQNTYDVSVTARKYLDLYRMDSTRRGR